MTLENGEAATIRGKLDQAFEALNRRLARMSKGVKYGKVEDVTATQGELRKLEELVKTACESQRAEYLESEEEQLDQIPEEVIRAVKRFQGQAGRSCGIFCEVHEMASACWARVRTFDTYTQLDQDFRDTAEIFIDNLVGGEVNVESSTAPTDTEESYEKTKDSYEEEGGGESGAADTKVVGTSDYESSTKPFYKKTSGGRFATKNKGKYPRSAFRKLRDDCAEAMKLFPTDLCDTRMKELRVAIARYEAHLKDMMIFYKGLYDLIKLETSSRQLPPEFLSELTPYLVKPFEFHNGLQKQLIELETLLTESKIGQCLDHLTEVGKELGASNTTFRRDLVDIDLKGAPIFVQTFGPRMDALLKESDGVCQDISRAASDAGILDKPDQVKGVLEGALSSLTRIRETSFFTIYNQLSEAIRLQKILPSWGNRATWLARVKQGLKEFWERVSEFTTEVRLCLEEIETEITNQAGVVTPVNATQIARDVAASTATIATALSTMAAAGRGDGGSARVPVAPVAAVASGVSGAANIDTVISQGIARALGNNLSALRNTDAQKLAFANQLSNAMQQSVVKTLRPDGTFDYQFQNSGATQTSAAGTGQIRGAQATYYEQVTKLGDQVSDLLDKLTSELSVPDEKTIGSLKDDIRSNMRDIAAELARDCGAVGARVIVLSSILGEGLNELGTALGIILPPAGSLKDMDIATREENERNFRLLGDLIRPAPGSPQQPKSSLQTLLEGYAGEIGDAKGTLLNNLLRTIQAIPNTIDEAYSAMDSSWFGDVERRSTTIDQTTTTVEQLFTWIEESATTEWPARLGIGDTKRIEVIGVQRAADGQWGLLSALRPKLPTPAGTDLVKAVLDELLTELSEVSRLAGEILKPPPTIAPAA